MNSENKDWKPEVGKTAWLRTTTSMRECTVLDFDGSGCTLFTDGHQTWETLKWIFPTADAALQSIKVYDLEGKEVVIPRARVDLPDHTHLLNGIDKCHECGGESGDPGKIAKLEYSADMGYKPYRRDVDEKSWEEVIDFYIDWKNSNWLDLQRLYGFLNTQVDSLDRIRRYEELTRGYNQDRREGGC